MTPEKQDTLWLPDGYGKGTIVFSLDGTPYEVGELVTEAGTNIRKVVKVEPGYAEMRIKNGAPVLRSE